MPVIENQPPSGYDRRVFDDAFDPISYTRDGDRMTAIELLVKRAGHTYLLSVESYEQYLKREATELPDDGPDEDNRVLVLPGDELLPSDLLNIKNMAEEEIAPFLIEQE